MNYYPHHIGDFRSGTVNMSRMSRWLYRDMLDVYYDTEKPLPLDLDVLCDKLGIEAEEERRLVERLLRFKFVRTDEGYRNDRCDFEIAGYHVKADTAKSNGKRGGRPRKVDQNPREPDRNPWEPDQNPTEPDQNPNKPSGFLSGSYRDAIGNPDLTGSEANQEPRTNNQEPTTENNTSRQSQDGDASGGKESKPAKKAKAHGTDEDLRAVRWMHGRVKVIDPTAKDPKWDGWANEMRLMREIDGRTHREACDLFDWANRDTFWRKNILSPSKLREKWQQLVLARQSAQEQMQAAMARSSAQASVKCAGAAAAIFGDDDDDGDDDQPHAGTRPASPTNPEGVIDVAARVID